MASKSAGMGAARGNSVRAIFVVTTLSLLWIAHPGQAIGPALPQADPVVVATFDTGTNPFHPCFRRPGTSPNQVVRGFPTNARPLELAFGEGWDYPAVKDANTAAINSIADRTLYYIPDTNLTFYGGTGAREQLVDYYPHGSQASSQIGCEKYGMAANAVLVILNWYREVQRESLVTWAADQPWIDVIHLNIQDYPLPIIAATDIRYAIEQGKMVVIAAGNGVYGQGASYPMELSHYNAPPGSLIAGANDNGGWASYSNLDPHVVMDGVSTRAAAPYSFGETNFSGTSSASPRISGYVARLIGALRDEFGHSGPGLVRIPAGQPMPATGPLADGVLTAAELHEVVRKTANPNPHESYYDGSTSLPWGFPQPIQTQNAVYAKMGYGEVSEHTIGAALDVAAGRVPMPERSEDMFYAESERLRAISNSLQSQ